MRVGQKKIITLLVLVILIISLYFVIVQYQITKITEDKVEKIALFVKIFSDEKSGTVPFEVNLTSLVLYFKGNVQYYWDFGDNKTSNEIRTTHIYNESGLFNCNLTVTDSSGEKSSDSIEIIAMKNLPPSVGMKLSKTTLSRKYIPMLPLLATLQKGRLWENLLGSSAFPRFLVNMFSDIKCEAQINDPEGDEIVSYEWKLDPPFYKKFGGAPIYPVYYFNGSNITLPLVYTYREGEYFITLKVKDSAGNEGEVTNKFNIRQSTIEDVEESISLFRTFIWPVTVKPLVGTPVANFINDTIWPSLEKYPVAQLTLFLVLLVRWQLDLTVYSGLVLLPTIKNTIDKYPALKPIVKNFLVNIQNRIKNRNPDSPLIDRIQVLLEDLGLANKRPILSYPEPPNNYDNIAIDTQKVSITVEDPEGDPFNVTISGDYVNSINYPFEQYNDTFNATLITPLPYDTYIYWNVNVSYSQNRWVNQTYVFKTRWS